MAPQIAIRIPSWDERDESQICYWKNVAGNWWIYKPGSWTAKLRNHTVIENEDGTITVEEPIVFDGPHGRYAKGFLIAGVWTDA